MRRAIVLSTLVAIATLSIAVKAYQQPAAPRVVEVEKLKDNFFLLKGGGGNTAVFVMSNGITVVDTKNPGWGQPILDKIKEISTKPVVRIINTHTHGDHVSGNVEFPPTVDVITHENTKKYMERMDPVYGLAPQTPPAENIFKKNDGRGMPKRTFTETWTIGSGQDQIDLRYFGRAHTGGDAYVIFPALRVMHVGDTMPTRDFPIMDKNNGGSGVNYSGTLAKAAAVKNIDTIINGHNATTTTPADLKLYAEFIADFVKFVQDAKKSGKSIDDVVTTWSTPAKYTGYNKPNTDRLRADAQVIWEETK